LYKLGFDTIILVGQDLALTGNRSHADGTFEEHMPELDTKNAEWVEGNCEEKVPTRTDLKVFLTWYEENIKLFKDAVDTFRVINATEGGAKIKGAEVMTLKEAIEENCGREVDIQKCLSELEPMLGKESQKWAEEYLQSIPREFERLHNDAMRLRKLYQDLGRICSGRKVDEQGYLKLLKKIKKQIRRVEKYQLYQLVCMTMPSALTILRQEELREEGTMEEEGRVIAQQGKLYAELVGQGATLLEEEAKKIYDGWSMESTD
jgi:hypothetical protein